MVHKFCKILIVFLLIISFTSFDFFMNVAYADQDPGGGGGDVPTSSEDPTGTIFLVIGGVVLVGGIIYYVHKHMKNKKIEKAKNEGLLEETNTFSDKIRVGLDIENGNMAAKNNKAGEMVAGYFVEAIKKTEKLVVIQGISLAEARADIVKYIPYFIMGEVKLFGDIYEIELRTLEIKKGNRIYDKKIVSESPEEIETEIEKSVEEIYAKIKEL